MSYCRACGRSIRWARTPAGKLMPLDAKPDPAGNVTLERVDPDNAHPVLAHVHAAAGLEQLRAEVDAGSLSLWMPHHATCPNWSRRRR